MNNLVVVSMIAAILAIGMMTAPVFADSNQIKSSNKQNIHVNNHGGNTATSGTLTDNDVNQIGN